MQFASFAGVFIRYTIQIITTEDSNIKTEICEMCHSISYDVNIPTCFSLHLSNKTTKFQQKLNLPTERSLPVVAAAFKESALRSITNTVVENKTTDINKYCPIYSSTIAAA